MLQRENHAMAVFRIPLTRGEQRVLNVERDADRRRRFAKFRSAVQDMMSRVDTTHAESLAALMILTHQF